MPSEMSFPTNFTVVTVDGRCDWHVPVNIRLAFSLLLANAGRRIIPTALRFDSLGIPFVGVELIRWRGEDSHSGSGERQNGFSAGTLRRLAAASRHAN